jgi:hypothetical protein
MQSVIRESPCSGVGVRIFIDYPMETPHGGSIIIPVCPAAFRKSFPVGWRYFPLEIVIAGGCGLLNGVAPDKLEVYSYL